VCCPPRKASAASCVSRWRSLALPAFFVIGFTLCYTSALQAPAPHGVLVAVAGPAAQTARLRDGLAMAAGQAFAVQAAPTPAAAAREVADQDLDGAYVPTARPRGTATVIIAAASGNSVTAAVESLFRAVAAKQGRFSTCQKAGSMGPDDTDAAVDRPQRR